MAMAAPIATITAIPLMPIDPRLLTLTQWLSPNYPVGSFAYSHGIESAIADGQITDAASLEVWLSDLLACGSLQADVAFLHRAFDAPDIIALNNEARAFAASAERLREAERQGAAFAKVTREVWDIELPDLLLPIALGHAAQMVGIDADALCAIYRQSTLSNLIAAAQRLMPLGQTDAQMILSHLTPLCMAKAPGTPYSNTFLSDIAAMRHETLSPRIFQS